MEQRNKVKQQKIFSFAWYLQLYGSEFVLYSYGTRKRDVYDPDYI